MVDSSLLVLGGDFLGMATVSEELSFEAGMEQDRVGELYSVEHSITEPNTWHCYRILTKGAVFEGILA